MLDRPEAEQNIHTHLSLMDRIRRRYDLTPPITLVFGLTVPLLCCLPHISTPLCFQGSLLD